MPSGTGKTITLLSLIVAYQLAHPERSKLVYCSRTVPEIEKTLGELRHLLAFIERSTQQPVAYLGVGVASRKNLCINAEVANARRGRLVDSLCHARTAPWVREVRERESRDPAAASSPTCSFFENLTAAEAAAETEDVPVLPTSGVFSLEDLRALGHARHFCPYYVARHVISRANCVVFSFQYLLDPKVAEFVSRDFPRSTIVVFDEAHNIDNVCIEAMSVHLPRSTIDAALTSVNVLQDRIAAVKQKDAAALLAEYRALIAGLQKNATSRDNDDSRILANPVLPADVIDEAVPGNIRKAEHFVAFLRRFIEYLKAKSKGLNVTSETPIAFLQHVRETALIERKPLRFAAERLASLVRTLRLTDLGDHVSLKRVADFASLCSTYLTGFCVLFEPFGANQQPTVRSPILRLCCLDASIAMRPVFARFGAVVITSGTLSPLQIYPRMLDFVPVLMETLHVSLARNSACPLIVARGSDQIPLSSKFEMRSDVSVVRNYGLLLLELCRVVPDGVVCFFPSYAYLRTVVAAWEALGMFAAFAKFKLVFVETPDVVDTTQIIGHFRTACNTGRGAVLLAVARGKFSEGVDFDHHFGRAVVMFGIPYQNTESRQLRERLEFLRDAFRIAEVDFLTFDAMRHAAQCLGRVLRGKNDYGLMIFADRRYARHDKRAKLPRWIDAAIADANASLSTDSAAHVAKHFFREMAQPLDLASQLGVSLWDMSHVTAALGQGDSCVT